MAIKNYSDLNSLELDTLKEIGSIGTGNAATALSSLIGQQVRIEMPEVRIMGYNARVYPDGVHDFKYEGDGTMVINLAWSHAVDDMGLWDNYGNLNRDLLWILRMPREEATQYISEEEYDSLPWSWEKAGDPRWEVELIRRMAYGEGDLSVIL